MMKVLIACEMSGRVRESFRELGHDAWSCDIQPSEIPGNHIQDDVLNHLYDGWDLMIGHPPCTYLSRAGARYWNEPARVVAAESAMQFFMALWDAPIKRIALENPIGKVWDMFRRPDQIVHPHQFGDGYTKATCLWLKQLPPLLYTCEDPKPFVNWIKYGPYKDSKNRSRTPWGLARAMANQWGSYGN
jgi:hypothetical protein